MPKYVIPTLKKISKVSKKQDLLVVSADNRLSANQNCRAKQKEWLRLIQFWVILAFACLCVLFAFPLNWYGRGNPELFLNRGILLFILAFIVLTSNKIPLKNVCDFILRKKL